MNEQPSNPYQPEPRDQPPIDPQPPVDPPQNPWQPAEIEPATEPQPSFTPPAVEPQPQPPKRRKKGMIIAIIIAIIVVLGAGAAAAYKFWYQNPQKVISDAVVNAMQAKTTTFNGKIEGSGPTKIAVTMKGGFTRGTGSADVTATFTFDDKQYTVDGGAIYDDKSDFYVKVNNLDDLVKDQRQQIPATMQSLVDDFIAKINSRWIRISSDDIKGFSEELAKSQSCIQDAYEKFQDDKSVSSEIIDLYKQHPFVTIKDELGSKNGSLGYTLGIDEAKSRDYGNGLKDTKLYKSLHECDKNITIDDEMADSTSEAADDDTKTEVWVSRWTHELTNITATVNESKPDEKMTTSFDFAFNKDFSVKAPDDAKSIKDLMQDLQDLQNAVMMEQLKAQGVTTDTGNSSFSSEL